MAYDVIYHGRYGFDVKRVSSARAAAKLASYTARQHTKAQVQVIDRDNGNKLAMTCIASRGRKGKVLAKCDLKPDFKRKVRR